MAAPKITRDSFLYLAPKTPEQKSEFAQCAPCRMFVPEKFLDGKLLGSRCVIHGSFTEVDEDYSCGFMLPWPNPNEPKEEVVKDHAAELMKMIPGSVSPVESGLVDRRVQCHRCTFQKEDATVCGLYENLNRLLPETFDLDTEITPNSCCNAQEPAESSADEADGVLKAIPAKSLTRKINKVDITSAEILKALDRAGLDLEGLKISIEVEDTEKAKETVSKPFAGFENFEACVLHQTGKGHSAESARKICGALQRDTEKEGDEPQSAGAELEVPGEKKPTETEKILAKGFSIFKTAEERFVLGIVLEPTKELNKPDSQGDIYSADEVSKAADKFMSDYQKIGIQHKEMTDKVKILRNWVTLEDSTINGQSVAKGTWLLGVRVLDDDLWTKVKKGEITAFSIGGKANREEIE